MVAVGSQPSSVAPGQVVRFRRRLWRVDDIAGDELTATPIDGSDTHPRRFFLSLEQPAPAALTEPDPQTAGDASAQDLLLRAYRLSLIHGSAPFLSLQRSSVIPVNYQLVPLVMALEQPRVRMLIADDVGLGKTIEAGLIVSELLARGRARRLLVVTPANLREQWADTLDRLFHLPMRIIASETRREFERELPAGSSPWQYFDRVIVSIDYAKQPHVKLQLLEQAWDIVVVDEAHGAARPHQAAAEQRVEMDRWQFVRELAPHAQHLLLLTATPHNGYSDTFASLFEMLDPALVAGPPHVPRLNRTLARRHVCQRSRKSLEAWFAREGQRSRFPTRDHKEEIVTVGAALDRALTAIRTEGRRLVGESAGIERRRILNVWLALHLQKRALSSPAALRTSVENRLAELERLLGPEQAGAAADSAPAPPLVAQATVLDQDPGDRGEEEAGRQTEKTFFADRQSLERQREALQAALDLARRVPARQDSKLQHLLRNTLPALLRADPRVIVFTRYRDTLDYLAAQIRADDPGLTVIEMHGSLSEGARRERLVEFERASRAVMVATDVISEGLNLQHAANQVVHYELPWNPNRLEQRNGRVDRFGQPNAVVRIRTLVMDDSLDLAILNMLVRKAERIRQERGFAPPFFGDERNVVKLLFSQAQFVRGAGLIQSSLFDRADAGNDVFDPLSDATIERVAQESFYGEVDVSLPDVEARLERTHQQIGSPAEIERFVRSALNRYRCRIEPAKDATLTIYLPESRLRAPGRGDRLEKACFDPQVAMTDPEVTVLDLGHPLVRRLVDLVREDFFRDGADAGRTSSWATSVVSEVTAVGHLLVRFMAGGEPSAVLEELVPFAFAVYGEAVHSPERAAALWSSPKAPQPLRAQQIASALQAVVASPGLARAREAAVRERLDALMHERRELRQRLQASGESAAPWMASLDAVRLTSQDLLTLTVLFPA